MCKIQLISCGNVNCYLVTQNNTSILVDTGREKDRDKILKLCEAANVKLIVLTHGHIDHIQNAAYLSQKLNTPIAISREDSNLTKDNMLEPLSAKGLLGKLVLKASIRSFKKDKVEPFTAKVFLKEGDMLTDFGIQAKVVNLAGHTKGSIGLDMAEKFLIVGDALMNMVYPTVTMLYGNRENMLKSADKISSIGERTIYFGHGKPVRNRKWNK